ncbi:hypothetical protein DPX16_3155 [Anabarilius grahami]|uniref:Uncharacterized protein n=1 Tax=Anabarilius grahami TaxID=495550 RepID=A0A3N0YYU8_ANAGA|nr:hypothetical protein DPX16_3155 [Anabarilius grahami]
MCRFSHGIEEFNLKLKHQPKLSESAELNAAPEENFSSYIELRSDTRYARPVSRVQYWAAVDRTVDDEQSLTRGETLWASIRSGHMVSLADIQMSGSEPDHPQQTCSGSRVTEEHGELQTG